MGYRVKWGEVSLALKLCGLLMLIGGAIATLASDMAAVVVAVGAIFAGILFEQRGEDRYL
jgi:hypothetical protein